MTVGQMRTFSDALRAVLEQREISHRRLARLCAGIPDDVKHPSPEKAKERDRWDRAIRRYLAGKDADLPQRIVLARVLEVPLEELIPEAMGEVGEAFDDDEDNPRTP